jgi:CHAT domain-containing protein/Tfp pilus assembly protein PilF
MVQGFRRRCVQGLILLTLPAVLGAGKLPAQAVAASTGRQSSSSTLQSSSALNEATQLELGKPLERNLAPGEAQSYRITLSAGQYAGVIVEQEGVDIVLKSFTPDDRLIADFDSENRPTGEERGAVVAEVAGSYKLKVEAKFKSLPGGRYTIRLEEIRLATENDRSLQEARKLYAEAARLTNAGEYSEAEDAAQRSLEIRQKIIGPNHPDIALTLTLLANAAYYKGDFARSEALNQRSIAMMEKTLGPDHPQTATRLNNLASVYQVNGDWVKAEMLHRRALEIRERSLPPDHPDIAQSLNNLANVYNSLGDFVSAEPLYLRAIAINEKVLGAKHPNLAYPLGNLGEMYMDEAEYDKAEFFLNKALAIREENLGPDHPLVALLLYNLGEVYRGRGDYAKAEELHERALMIRESKLGADHAYVGTSLHKLGNIYFSQKNYAKAESYYRRALSIEEATLGPQGPNTLGVINSLATLYMVKNEPTQAVAFQSRALAGDDYNIDLNLAIGSERQKQAYLATLPEELDRAISLHVRLASDDPAARDLAATAILQRKGRILDAMSQNLSSLRTRMDPQHQALLDQLRSVTIQLARLVLNGPQRMTAAEHQDKIKTAEAEREKLEVEVSRRSAGFYRPSTPATLAAVRSAIPGRSALIEFAIYRPFDPQKAEGDAAFGEPRYVAYVISRENETQWKDLGPASEIDTAVAALREALRAPQRTDALRLARALDQKLMQPLRPFFGKATRLLISPDGELSLLPLEALADEQGHYLIERYFFTYLTSGRDLLRMQVARPKDNRPLVIADPLFGEPRLVPSAAGQPRPDPSTAKSQPSVTTGENLSGVYFAPLSGTAQEARDIRLLFPDARVLTGAQATKNALQQVKAPGILHIATHGFFLEDAAATDSSDSARSLDEKVRLGHLEGKINNPLLRSGLALAGANLNQDGNDNGILTALEASTLDLWGTKLVTLSACDTGVGEVKNGEGVYGLRRAFVLAGAESMVMSLWPVSDRVTREIMTAYYTGLKRGLGRGEALRQAELAIMKRKDRRHPFYWASFIQSGEWGDLDGHR